MRYNHLLLLAERQNPGGYITEVIHSLQIVPPRAAPEIFYFYDDIFEFIL